MMMSGNPENMKIHRQDYAALDADALRLILTYVRRSR